jgi:uncharacterized membrane protein YhaH (DUF805 family)
VTVYFITLAGVMLCATASGWWLGRRSPARNDKHTFKFAGLVIGLAILWFATALLARFHADTDRPGATLAEWFAHAGKWWILLVAVMFGYGLAYSRKRVPRAWSSRVLYFGTLLVLVGLVIYRDGSRDANGYLRQSPNHEYTCAAVALLNYLEQYHGLKGLTEREVSQKCGITTEGATTAALVRAAHRYGLTNARARGLSLTELEQLGRPAIVFISTLPKVHHATLLVKLDADQAHFLDPAYGRWSLPRDRFREVWYGRTVLLE